MGAAAATAGGESEGRDLWQPRDSSRQVPPIAYIQRIRRFVMRPFWVRPENSKNPEVSFRVPLLYSFIFQQLFLADVLVLKNSW
jgi:hypothetical protein